MLISYRDKFIKVFIGSLLLFTLGVVLMLWSFNNFTSNDFSFVSWKIGMILLGIGYILYFWSHYLLAKAKGYSGWLILLGFINTIGILILFLLPDKSKQTH